MIAPGLRVGYGVLPDHLAQRVAAAALDTYVSPPLWPQAEVYEFLTAGFLPPQLARLRDCCGCAATLWSSGWPQAWTAGLVTGGPPTAATSSGWSCREGISAAALLADCERAGVTFVPGSGFFADGGGDDCARLSFSFPGVADIRPARTAW